MEFKIDKEAIKEVVSEAILRDIDKDTRDQIIKDAIKFLVTPPPKKSWSDQAELSPLQEAWQHAIRGVVGDFVHEEIKKPEVKAVVDAHLSEALKLMLSESFDFSRVVADAFTESFRRK